MKDDTLNFCLEEETLKFREAFISENNLHEFSQKEQKWIENNLGYLYSEIKDDVVFKINPHFKIVSIINPDSNSTSEYVLLPKSLPLGELYVHVGLIEKADKILHLMINYNKQFTYNELSDVLLGKVDGRKRVQLNERLAVIIRKFLSYQYLVIA